VLGDAIGQELDNALNRDGTDIKGPILGQGRDRVNYLGRKFDCYVIHNRLHCDCFAPRKDNPSMITFDPVHRITPETASTGPCGKH
ncbi:hypothetical protein LCGC14_1850760, partial [marine sediment metagenome]